MYSGNQCRKLDCVMQKFLGNYMQLGQSMVPRRRIQNIQTALKLKLGGNGDGLHTACQKLAHGLCSMHGGLCKDRMGA